MIDIEKDWIDVEAHKGKTRILCPWGTEKLWIGFSTHRLNALVQSCVFSPPSHIFQMEAYGSKGKHTSYTDSWGEGVGYVRGEHETRDHYWKMYSIMNEPPQKINQLRFQFKAHHVKNPIVHFIYCKRGSPPLYMLWCYTHSFKPNFAISTSDRQTLQDLARDQFEPNFTISIFAASEIKLSQEDMEIAILNAHDWDYIYDRIRPVLMTAHGQPLPHARLEFPEAPRVVTKVVPITAWARNTF